MHLSPLCSFSANAVYFSTALYSSALTVLSHVPFLPNSFRSLSQTHRILNVVYISISNEIFHITGILFLI